MSFFRLRVLTAVLLGASAVAFAAGTSAERAQHHDVPLAEPTPTESASLQPSNHVTPTASASSRAGVKPSATRDPRLSAPEGSKEREAGERAARKAAAEAAARAAASARASALAAGRTPPPLAASPTPTVTADASAPEGSAARESSERAGATSATESSERLFGINPESTGLVDLAVASTLLILLLVLLLPLGTLLQLAVLGAIGFCLAATGLDIREALHQQSLRQTGLMWAAIGVAALHVVAAIAAALLLRSVVSAQREVRSA